MFKPIPGHESLQISLNGQMQYSDGSACALPAAGGKVEITLYGQTRWLDLHWLALIAHYELRLPDGHQHRLFEIGFVHANPKLRRLVCGKIPVIRRGVEVRPGFRLVLSYPHLAVSRSGDVWSLKTNALLTQYHMAKGYRNITTWSPDKSKNTTVGVHRLVAMAWVPNHNWIEAYIVNHKDGRRDNNRAKNLEWVSFTGNADHAVLSGARPETIACRVLDTQTNVEHTFPSQRRAAEFMGLDPDALKGITLHRTPGRLIHGRYEYRPEGDERSWFSRTHGQKPSGRYTIHLTYPDGRQEDHPDVRTFIRQFKVWNASGIEKVETRFRQLYPDVVFQVTDHFDCKPLQAKEITSGRELSAPTIRAMEDLTGDDFNTIRRALQNVKSRKDPKWLYRFETTEPWNLEVTYDKSRPKRILATHAETQAERMFDSLRACATAMGVDRDLIKLRLTSGRDYQGWMFREI